MRISRYVLSIAIGMMLMGLGIIYLLGRLEGTLKTPRVVASEPAKELKEIAHILANASQKTTVDVNYHSDQRFDEILDEIEAIRDSRPQIIVKTKYVTREAKKPERKKEKRRKPAIVAKKAEIAMEEPRPAINPALNIRKQIDYNHTTGQVYEKN
jgi:vacuolar-type H+-ATPase subunit F/Vma7